MCGDLEPVRRILAAEDYFTALACEVHQSDEFVLLSSGICPDRFDANHARCIRSARSPREFVRGVERLFRDAGRGFCAFATDMRTAPAQLTLALREADYAPEPGVVQVLDRGSRRRFARRRDIEVIKLTSDAATQAMGDWATLAAGRYAGWDPPGIAQSAVELDRGLEAAGLGAGTGNAAAAGVSPGIRTGAGRRIHRAFVRRHRQARQALRARRTARGGDWRVADGGCDGRCAPSCRHRVSGCRFV